MNKYDSSIKDLQAQINILQMEKEANENQIKSLMKEVEDNQDLKEKYNKPGNVYLGLVHRLDRPTRWCNGVCKNIKSCK